MKKTILTLFVCLSCIMIAKADRLNPSVVDTLPKRIINGLEVIPIRTTYKSGEIFWKLRASEFNKCFQKFESKYPGGINYSSESRETVDAIYDWQDHIWETVVPADIKALEGVDIMLFVDKGGHIFTADFSMTDEVFQKLNTLPQNTLKNLYHNLIKEKCKTIKDVEIHALEWDNEFNKRLIWAICGSKGIGKEYVTMNLSWYAYDLYGTSNSRKVLEMPREEIEKIHERMRRKMQEKTESRKNN